MHRAIPLGVDRFRNRVAGAKNKSKTILATFFMTFGCLRDILVRNKV